MKKVAIILACVLFFVGCSNGAGGNAQQSEPSIETSSTLGVYEGEITLNFLFGTRTGTYSGEIDENGLPDGRGKFTSKNSTGEIWTYEGEWIAGHWEGTGTSTWESGQVYSGEFTNDSETGSGTFIMETGEKYEGTFNARVLSGDGILYYPDGSSFIGTFTDFYNATGEYCDKDGVSYEATIKDGELDLRPLCDFFSDEERQNQYNNLYQSYRYSELIAYINEYLSENDATPLDSAYAILDLIIPASQYEENWNISLDEFDSKYVLSFVGADSITKDSSVAVSVEGTSLNIKVGFRKTDWLFFDHIELSINGERVYTARVNSYDCTRNVISGNTIEEYCECGFYDSVLEQLETAETAILRFSCEESGEVYDHTLTQNEIDALYCGLLLRVNNRELSNLIYRYNNPK